MLVLRGVDGLDAVCNRAGEVACALPIDAGRAVSSPGSFSICGGP